MGVLSRLHFASRGSFVARANEEITISVLGGVAKLRLGVVMTILISTLKLFLLRALTSRIRSEIQKQRKDKITW